MNIPKPYQDLFEDESKALLYLATIMPDGTPQVTPIWFNSEGEYLLINTAAGRVKDKNMQARPHVAMVIQNLDDPYRYIQIRGKVVQRTTAGAEEHINKLSHKYHGKDWTINAGETRVRYKISIDSISGH